VTSLLDVALPLLVIFVMTVVGLELAASDFARARARPVAIPALLAGQWLAAFVVAALMGRWSWIPAPAAAGLLLLAAAPAAPLVNYYAQLSRGAVAMSVTVTALATVVAPFVTPLVAAQGFGFVGRSRVELALPGGVIALQLLLGLLMPVATGMLIRSLAPARAAAWRPPLQRASLGAIVVVLGVVLVDQWAVIADQAAGFAAAALIFTVALLAVGVLATRLAGLDAPARRALVWGFPVRSVAVAFLLASDMGDGRQVIAAVAVVFVVQASIGVPLALWFAAGSRWGGGRSPGPGAAGDPA
jgi:BASS family bile acid:Na+ symporter